MKKENRREVRNLIFLLSTASCLAFFVVVAFIYYFGSSGTFLLKEVLISPETLKKIAFRSYDPIKKTQQLFVFDKIEFIHGEKRYAIDLPTYTAFYKWISSERSVPVVNEHMASQFNTQKHSVLNLIVCASGNIGSLRTEKIFQQVQFTSNGELFRVQFQPSQKQEKPSDEWIYFRFAGIYDKAITLFTGNDNGVSLANVLSRKKLKF